MNILFLVHLLNSISIKRSPFIAFAARVMIILCPSETEPVLESADPNPPETFLFITTLPYRCWQPKAHEIRNTFYFSLMTSCSLRRMIC